MQVGATQNEAEREHAKWMRQKSQILGVTLCLLLPVWLLSMFLDAFDIESPVSRTAQILSLSGAILLFILIRRAGSRAIRAREQLLRSQEGLWCLSCWYPTPETEGGFGCTECGAEWEADVVRRYLTPPIKKKIEPAPIKPGDTDSLYQLFMTVPRTEEQDSPESLKKAGKRIRFRTYSCVVAYNLIVLLIATIIGFSMTSLVTNGVLLSLMLALLVMIYHRHDRAFIRRRNEYASRHDFKVCPKCFEQPVLLEHNRVGCQACGREWSCQDLERHFQSSIGACGEMPSGFSYVPSESAS
ncbi:hypothetical protein JYT11_00560 [Planctomycetaceae bacterium AH-315-I19]|nr:hypothetical protein [Planctomycetaceae bacterium AH-315-I19]